MFAFCISVDLDQLAVLSFFTNAISIMLQDREAISDKGFFHGYSALVWTIICVSSLGGILVRACLCYLHDFTFFDYLIQNN